MSVATTRTLYGRALLTAPRTLLQRHSACSSRRQTGAPRTTTITAPSSRAFCASSRSTIASSLRTHAPPPPSLSSSDQREPDPGGKPIPTDGSYRTVYDDFNNITSSPEDDAMLNVRSMGEANFTLTDGLVCYTPIILLQRSVLLWDAPPLGTTASGGAEAVVMPNGTGWEAWTDDVWSVFEVASPRPEIVIFGTGKTVLPPPAKIRQYLNRLGIQIEAHSTVRSVARTDVVRVVVHIAEAFTCPSQRNACSTYNMLIDEGRVVAAALLPNVRRPTKRIQA